MEKQYIEKRDEGYWITGSRVSLESVLFAFLEGLSPETIAAECFPTLTLEQVYGAITHYLAHRNELDAYLKHADAAHALLREATRKTDPAFTKKLTQARRSLKPSRP